MSLDGKVYNDKNLGRRAVSAAFRISQTRGWEDVRTRGITSRGKCYNDIRNALKTLNKYSWDGFKAKMEEKGYHLTENCRKDGSINGYYILMPGQTKTPGFKGIKASDINRQCTYTRLRNLWLETHASRIASQHKSSHPGRLTDVSLSKRWDGWIVRCKEDGVQQMGQSLPLEHNALLDSLAEGDRISLIDTITSLLEGVDVSGLIHVGQAVGASNRKKRKGMA